MYYSLELRGIPMWQPLRKNKLLEFADISYWQWVLFAETDPNLATRLHNRSPA